jgi:hypothetical protein
MILGVVDALQLDRRDSEVRVTQLALDDDQRDALAGHLDAVRVAKLMRCEPTAHACSRAAARQAPCARPPLTTRPAGRPVGDA